MSSVDLVVVIVCMRLTVVDGINKRAALLRITRFW